MIIIGGATLSFGIIFSLFTMFLVFSGNFPGLPFLATLPLAMLLAGAVGAVVGLASLRVRADFLAITTMGVGFLFVGIVRQQNWLGGELGISGIPDTGLSKTAFMLLTLLL